MAFITASDVASYSALDAATITAGHISAAEALAASFIGAPQLGETVHSGVKIYPENSSRYLSLPFGPVASISKVTSLAIAGVTISISDLVLDGYWALLYPTGWFASGNLHLITFTSGWSSLPAKVKEAAVIIAADLAKNPDKNMEAEKLGDHSYTAMEYDIPKPAQILLGEYINPELCF